MPISPMLNPTDDPEWVENLRVSFGQNELSIMPVSISASPDYVAVTIFLSMLTDEDPFESMHHWLKQIMEDRYPALWYINGEGDRGESHIVMVEQLPNSRLIFKITSGYANDDNPTPVFSSVVSKKQMINQFIRADKKRKVR